MRKRTSGFTLLELLTVLSIIGLMVLVAVPAFATLRRKALLRAASIELRSIFHLARMRAIARSTNCGLKFMLLGGEWHFAVYDDADGDGVRNDDIAEGIDKLVKPPRVVFPTSPVVRIGLLEKTIRDPDGDRLIAGTSPVRFNRSAICSFSPLGESTPGTIYLTDRGQDLYAVRVYGATAKIRVLRYDHGTGRWTK